MAQSDPVANLNSVRGALFGDDHVLLVSPGHYQQTFMVYLCGAFFAEYISEHHIALEIITLNNIRVT